MTAVEPGRVPLEAEWLEADGLGGFASGTVSGERTRRYHALLLIPTAPPAGRVVLVNGIEAWVETETGPVPISTQRYLPDVVHPRGLDALRGFTAEPWPTWTFGLPGGLMLSQEILVAKGSCETVLRWRLVSGSGPLRLIVRPLLSGRDYHGTHHDNPAFNPGSRIVGQSVVFHPYPDLPAVTVLATGAWHQEPVWFHRFFYREERARGLAASEDLASPGWFAFDVGAEDALLVLRAGDAPYADGRSHGMALIETERTRREHLGDPLERAAESYIIRRGRGRTVLAGFPWFTDWGRDTFIALRGLATARGANDLAEEVLLAWAETVSEGMLPNRFPDHGDIPEFNAVDASLWYVIAAYEHIELADPPPPVRARLAETIGRILDGYASGTRYGIHAAADGLIAAGVPGVQLTWMDAKIGDHVVTPRIGKPVEIQALWINALQIGSILTGEERWSELRERAEASFHARFWNEASGSLFDVVDAGHEPGHDDPRVRPNQIFAAGGLPFPVLDGERARAVVEVVERELWTPLGLRSLSPADPAYRGRYEGDVWSRDTAYHQGTVWAWLLGPFIDAWLQVHEGEASALATARSRFLAPLRAHLEVAGLGHISEIADGDPPHTPRGCPFQAWSLGELIRIECLVAGLEERRNGNHST